MDDEALSWYYHNLHIILSYEDKLLDGRDESKYNISGNGLTLTIHDVNITDSGNYTLRTTSESFTCSLTVIGNYLNIIYF